MMDFVKFGCIGEIPLLFVTLLPRLCVGLLLVKLITFGRKPRLRLSSINNLSELLPHCSDY